ncbi:F0F1 ATP synthase subunit B family protein [Candidatus Mycoplasma haematohominis]|uniref:F0F1 ATP synthase subunit B n=1 Tax=Candidatus Mycoplasma haematohominis TaxID=1494318 RepID=A0A478FQJ0_9MOLU|nr:hypothetical protein [Candidatus Mycoplasma haemohominis]GCE63828.1 F0F1 ATP synthase subunit B [Candidatus Mycoplasma haemohominis]
MESWNLSLLSGNSSTFAEKISKFVEEHLKMNVWVFLVHLVCAIIIMAFIAIWVWKPTNDFVANQKKKLEKEKNDLVVNNRETRYFLGLLKKEKNELFYTKRAITRAAIDEAERIRTEAQRSVNLVVADMQRKAEERIELMEEKAKEHIKEKIVNVALELTEKLVDANINDANNKAIIDAYLKELEEKKLVEGEARKLTQ